MVGSVTSLTRSGLRDWLIQRITAVILALYTLFLLAFILCHHALTYADWQALFANGFMRIFTFLALLSVVYHTWVGIWTVFTDYIKCSSLRLILQAIVVIALLGYLVWGISTVWGA
ncbi:MAG TPA: succinate dehydrogenase, hydrophobic membrane anchor protein [Gammaproteobacteria bacterium]|nr:succinate dehydrogenase, hydrophobic membrane anchor protein [Gammaproteobacteria bacterium]